MALDPGFRTDAKMVCLDAHGVLLHFTTIFPTHSGRRQAEASRVVLDLCQKYDIEAIAIGIGTASRETGSFIRSLATGLTGIYPGRLLSASK